MQSASIPDLLKFFW